MLTSSCHYQQRPRRLRLPAIRIVFPLIGVTPVLRWLGLPAMPGKQKKGLQNNLQPFSNDQIVIAISYFLLANQRISVKKNE